MKHSLPTQPKTMQRGKESIAWQHFNNWHSWNNWTEDKIIVIYLITVSFSLFQSLCIHLLWVLCIINWKWSLALGAISKEEDCFGWHRNVFRMRKTCYNFLAIYHCLSAYAWVLMESETTDMLFVMKIFVWYPTFPLLS